MKFFKLGLPFNIGNLTVRNRFVMPAMHLNFAENGFVNEQLTEFYRVRAKGGVGLIIVGGVGVEKRGHGVPMMIAIDEDKYIPGLHQLTDAIHKEGAKICCQLYHAGAYAFRQLTGEAPVSSSAVYTRFTHDTPRSLEISEIKEIEENIAKAAGRSADAGFDGVEMLSSAGYLIDQFLSPIRNLRTDRYGGKTLEDRLTFPLELFDTVRATIGSKIFMGCRFSGDDFVTGSNTYHEKIEVAKAYEKAGIQYLNVTGGWHETRVPQIPMIVPRATYAYLAKEIKSVVKIPVFASNRINDPVIAERLLQDGFCDAICMGRTLIADPEIPLKVQNNQIDRIRKCIGCNQGCFDGIFNLESLKCTINPYAGLETQYSNPEKAASSKKVIIVGSGPAGLEAAKTAHLMGHDVILYEKAEEIGGQVNVAWVPPGREEVRNIITYYQQEFDNLGVKYATGVDVTPEMIMEAQPDVVMFATGVHYSIPRVPGFDGSLNCSVCFADDGLAGNFPVGHRVVIIGAAATGVEVALWAALPGALAPESARFLSFFGALPIEEAMKRTYKGDKEITMIELLPKIATSVGKSTRWIFMDELDKMGVKVITNAKCSELRNNTAFFTVNGNAQTIENVDTFILATGVKTNRDLYTQCKALVDGGKFGGKIPDLQLLGDAKKIGTIFDAVHSGFKAAFKLGKVS